MLVFQIYYLLDDLVAGLLGEPALTFPIWIAGREPHYENNKKWND